MLRMDTNVMMDHQFDISWWGSGGTVRRWLDYIQQFDFVVKHRAGKYNTNADIISRALHMVG